MVHLHYNKELFHLPSVQLFHLPSVHSLYEEQTWQICEINYYILGFITHYKKSEIQNFNTISIKKHYNMLFYFTFLLK